MSAPHTNLETQQRRHRGPIIGIIVVVIFAVGLLVWQMLTVAKEGTPADNGAGQIDGRTGDVVPGSADPAVPPAADPAMVPPADPVLTPPADPVEVPPAANQP